MRVRKLVWVEPTKLTNGCWCAECELGVFSVAFDDGWHAELNDGRDWEWEPEMDPRSYEGPYAAQRACQAYRDARILSAIEDAGAREGAAPLTMPVAHDPRFPSSGETTKTIDGTLYNAPTPAGAGDLVERLTQYADGWVFGDRYFPMGTEFGLIKEAASRIEALEAEVAEKTAEMKAVTGHIPMDYLQRHNTPGATGPTAALKLSSAMRDYAADRWKLIDRVKAFEARATTAESDLAALRAEVETLQAYLWRDDEPRRDGVPFLGMDIYTMRWTPYSKKSEQYKRGWAGRWQRAGEHGGWDNCPTPRAWKPDPQYARAALANGDTNADT